MGQQESRHELLYKQAIQGNLDAVKALHREGAGLEWIDEEGKTTLVVTCKRLELFIVDQTLIDLGTNVNAYCPERHVGTPLHHAAKRGLLPTFELLLSHGANPLLRNDDGLTTLHVARILGSLDNNCLPPTVIALWKTDIEESNFHESDPSLIIVDKSNKTRYRFASSMYGDKQQLQWLYSTCRGTPQITPLTMAGVR